jgi:hypothetical protein|tara:strand:+ start:1731 stop:1958 length:228 start_codon:yes stop_codon:yes gene_type:complete
MFQNPLKVDDLNPDGVKVVVDWDHMVVGASVFLPCIDTEKTKQQIAKIAELKAWQVEMRVRIEDEMFGVRIWRTV